MLIQPTDIDNNFCSKDELINFIKNFDWKHHQISRYDIEFWDGKMVVTSRISVIDNKFTISIIVQEDADGDGSLFSEANWSDVDRIDYITGDLIEIENIITESIYNSFISEIVKVSNNLKNK